jgi:hypothetical protein
VFSQGALVDFRRRLIEHDFDLLKDSSKHLVGDNGTLVNPARQALHPSGRGSPELATVLSTGARGLLASPHADTHFV